MTTDPELKAMSEVFDALQGLDASTQKRVVDWVMAKLSSSPDTNTSLGAKRGPKPRSKKVGKKRSRKPSTDSAQSSTSNVGGSRRGPKPGSKRTGKKRGPKKGKGGRPPGSKNVSTGKTAVKSSGRRGRPSKSLLLP